jgi:hypothetical protein
VNPTARPKVIKAAYRALASEIAPDINPSPDANEKMVKINKAYEVLSDPVKRRDYNNNRQYKTSEPGKSNSPPKPAIDPYYIEFKNVAAGVIKKASFTVFNTGGHYTKINIGNPDSWLRVVAWHSISTNDELPLKVDIEAIGRDWYKRYSDVICVSLDNIQARVDVLLTTRFRLEITDHEWHNIEFENLKTWIKKRKDILDTGEMQRGKTFRYRLNKVTRKYQFRLRRDYPSAIYDPYD